MKLATFLLAAGIKSRIASGYLADGKALQRGSLLMIQATTRSRRSFLAALAAAFGAIVIAKAISASAPQTDVPGKTIDGCRVWRWHRVRAFEIPAMVDEQEQP